MFPATFPTTKLTLSNLQSQFTHSNNAMVGPIGPGKFYGSSLPRPRFYTDVKHNDRRVDPPPSVTDALMSWAEEAHWSMGGLSSKRHRLQGRIEGNVERLRAQRENEPDEHGKDDVRVITETSSPVEIKRGAVRKFGDAFERDCSGGCESGGAAAETTAGVSVGVGEGKANKRKKY